MLKNAGNGEGLIQNFDLVADLIVWSASGLKVVDNHVVRSIESASRKEHKRTQSIKTGEINSVDIFKRRADRKLDVDR